MQAAVTPDIVYDEVATKRQMQGTDQVLECWRGWSKAFPDSKVTFNDIVVGDDKVVMEVTWHGTHKGPLDAGKAGEGSANW
jgi:predicted ester cyclase